MQLKTSTVVLSRWFVIKKGLTKTSRSCLPIPLAGVTIRTKSKIILKKYFVVFLFNPKKIQSQSWIHNQMRIQLHFEPTNTTNLVTFKMGLSNKCLRLLNIICYGANLFTNILAPRKRPLTVKFCNYFYRWCAHRSQSPIYDLYLQML